MPFQQREQNGLVWFTADVLNQIPHGFSTRMGGVSPAPWDSLNLRPNQGDGPEALRENYRRFFAVLGLDEHRTVLSQQTHTANIRRVTAADAGKGVVRPRDYTDVDALITNEAALPLTVFSADCGTVLLYDPVRQAVGAAHAGWRGCAAGIVEKQCRPWRMLTAAVLRICWPPLAPASAGAALKPTATFPPPCGTLWGRTQNRTWSAGEPNSMWIWPV